LPGTLKARTVVNFGSWQGRFEALPSSCARVELSKMDVAFDEWLARHSHKS
jgi:hypothetical protein